MKRQHGVDGFLRRPSYMQVINHMRQGFPANESVPYPDIRYQTAEAGFINSQKFEIQPDLVLGQTPPRPLLEPGPARLPQFTSMLHFWTHRVVVGVAGLSRTRALAILMVGMETSLANLI